jgi:23S rRNA (cytosine1962-C5)-methyltransferase
MKNNKNTSKTIFYNIHPQSIKHLALGHPWVTKDSFTEKFPNKPGLIATASKDKKNSWIFIGDPEHKTVKARYWSEYSNARFKTHHFWNEFENRLDAAVSFREGLKILEERENFYLVFGEADQIPGLFIQRLGEVLLVQSYCNFWDASSKILFSILKKFFTEKYPTQVFKYFFQSRNKKQKIIIQEYSYKNEFIILNKPIDLQCSEFGLKYSLNLGRSYDIGVYTDMSSIRKKIGEYLRPGQSLLNLFCYTGAFSTFALKKGLKRVDSVDLSQKYLDVLNNNISANDLTHSAHSSNCKSVEEYLKSGVKDNLKYDHIICDPPTTSSDGKKTTNALKNYEQIIPMMNKVLNKEGYLYLFLNTHKVTWKKFENEITKIIKPLGLERVRRLSPSEDFKKLPGFIEGDYLKGLLLKKL